MQLTLETLILVLVFIAPGFLYSQTHAAIRRHYHRAPSAFEQTVSSVIASSLVHIYLLTVFALAAFISAWRYGYPIPPLRWLLTGTLGEPILGAIIILYFCLSLYVAWVSGFFWGWRASSSLWHTLLVRAPLLKGNYPPVISLQLRNRDLYRGTLYQLLPVDDEANTIELALVNARYQRSFTVEGRQVLYEVPERQAMVLLKSSDVLWLNVEGGRGELGEAERLPARIGLLGRAWRWLGLFLRMLVGRYGIM
jgi:hypothetical protein